MDRIVGAFIFPDVWRQWTEDDAKRHLEALADFGVNAIFTEAPTYRDDLIELAHQRGFRWYGAIACFSDHANDHQLLSRRPELWPVGESGRLRPQMEWYIGVTPTFHDYNQAILEMVQRAVQMHPLDGLFLDFVRWPIHWELESRAGAGPPSQSSFDPHTLERFQEETGIRLPGEPTDSAGCARWILTHHSGEWKEFKCAVITDFVSQAVARIRAVRGDDFLVGLYVPPLLGDELEIWAGQRLVELAGLVDVISPMAYHAILHRSPQWVGEVIADLSDQEGGRPLLPVVQVDSEEGKESGADWGPPIPLEEWESVLRQAFHSPAVRGLVAFTGTALLGKGRGEILRKTLKSS
ncbi:MAG: hypothetical protein V3R94_02755 [Acidobacteriota bacterium]